MEKFGNSNLGFPVLFNVVYVYYEIMPFIVLEIYLQNGGNFAYLPDCAC